MAFEGVARLGKLLGYLGKEFCVWLCVNLRAVTKSIGIQAAFTISFKSDWSLILRIIWLVFAYILRIEALVVRSMFISYLGSRHAYLLSICNWSSWKSWFTCQWIISFIIILDWSIFHTLSIITCQVILTLEIVWTESPFLTLFYTLAFTSITITAAITIWVTLTFFHKLSS